MLLFLFPLFFHPLPPPPALALSAKTLRHLETRDEHILSCVNRNVVVQQNKSTLKVQWVGFRGSLLAGMEYNIRNDSIIGVLSPEAKMFSLP